MIRIKSDAEHRAFMMDLARQAVRVPSFLLDREAASRMKIHDGKLTEVKFNGHNAPVTLGRTTTTFFALRAQGRTLLTPWGFLVYAGDASAWYREAAWYAPWMKGARP